MEKSLTPELAFGPDSICGSEQPGVDGPRVNIGARPVTGPCPLAPSSIATTLAGFPQAWRWPEEGQGQVTFGRTGQDWSGLVRTGQDWLEPATQRAGATPELRAALHGHADSRAPPGISSTGRGSGTGAGQWWGCAVRPWPPQCRGVCYDGGNCCRVCGFNCWCTMGQGASRGAPGRHFPRPPGHHGALVSGHQVW